MPASSCAPLTSATLVGSSWRLRSCCCPLTVTRSAKDISRGMLMRTSPALPTVISIVRSVNPRPSTVSRWSPSGSVSKRKEPAASLVVSRISPLARVRITSAPGTRRPWGSVTSPTISAFAAANPAPDDGATRASGDAGSRRAPSAAAPIERQRGTKRNMAEPQPGRLRHAGFLRGLGKTPAGSYRRCGRSYGSGRCDAIREGHRTTARPPAASCLSRGFRHAKHHGCLDVSPVAEKHD